MAHAPQPHTRQRATAARRDEDLDLRPLLSIADVAQILGLPKATLYRWHSLSTPETPVGPRAFRVGRYLRYTLGDVSSYIEGLRSSAS
jgi:predicted DNA-binding transcriptional regulator AlpA